MAGVTGMCNIRPFTIVHKVYVCVCVCVSCSSSGNFVRFYLCTICRKSLKLEAAQSNSHGKMLTQDDNVFFLYLEDEQKKWGKKLLTYTQRGTIHRSKTLANLIINFAHIVQNGWQNMIAIKGLFLQLSRHTH